MKIIIKKLQGGECYLDVLPTTTILEMKKEIQAKLGISIREQKLLLLGRTLADDQTVQSYGSLKDGAKVNLVVKKPENLHDAAFKYFRSCGLIEQEANFAAKKLVRTLDDKIMRMSWDDLDRLAADIMLNEENTSEEVLLM